MVSWLALAAVMLLSTLWMRGERREPTSSMGCRALRGLAHYAGMLIHAGFICLALGVTGSSLGAIADFTRVRARRSRGRHRCGWWASISDAAPTG
jgi:hypothetical protein